jgi:hypothetical protein
MLEKELLTKPFKLRLVRVVLDNEVEVLITNPLDYERYPTHEFKALHHLRWGVKESYIRLKMWVELEKLVMSVKQDFNARVLFNYLVAMVSNAAQRLIDKNKKRM